LGVWGEQLAAQRLSLLGWNILEKNYHLGRREVDLIMAKQGVLVFVEVKTRSGGRFGPPEAAVTPRKRGEIEAVARDFLMRYKGPIADVRFDVVAIVVGPDRHLVRYDHIEDAWRPSGR
jgi:putative endonuclease